MKTKCNYPKCKCPFDMGADNKCLIGLPLSGGGKKTKSKIPEGVTRVVNAVTGETKPVGGRGVYADTEAGDDYDPYPPICEACGDCRETVEAAERKGWILNLDGWVCHECKK